MTLTNNSNVVTGLETLWINKISVGNLFKLQGKPAIYKIDSVESDTQLKLTVDYAEPSGTGLGYCIVRSFSQSFGLPSIHRGDIDWPDFYNKAMVMIDQLL